MLSESFSYSAKCGKRKKFSDEIKKSKISAVLLDVFLLIIYNQHVVFQNLITLWFAYKIGKI